MGRSRIPIARTRALNATPNARSLSRMRYFGALSQGNASVIWRASHSAVGASDRGLRRGGENIVGDVAQKCRVALSRFVECQRRNQDQVGIVPVVRRGTSQVPTRSFCA